MNLQQTWRWFGPNDAVTLAEIRQTGATGIVSALHHIPCGEVWTSEEINIRKKTIEESGLVWSVVESVNIHESIKTAAPDRDQFIDNYIATLQNLSASGINVVCYNFMPVLDWTRTHLSYPIGDGSFGLRYDRVALAAFDLFILKREGAAADFPESIRQQAEQYIQEKEESDLALLQATIMAGLPGTDEVFTLEEFRKHLDVYKEIDEHQLKENLAYFLKKIIPVCEELGVVMCIHPDDPPFPILGLPRVVKNEQDLTDLLGFYPSYNNGITFCTGSLGGNGANDLPGMVRRLGSHIHFLHLRNVQREPSGSFYEADHLGGSVDMFEVMKAVIEEQQKRIENGRADIAIPVRPDHGHQYIFDANKKFYPGYSGVGRLRGLAELRGLEMGIRRMLEIKSI